MDNNKILKLFKESKYKEAEDLLKEVIEIEGNNADNYYYLFLASNKDYSSIDFNDLFDELYFNKALELANKKHRNQLENEFNFYRCLTPVMRKLFCYASRDNIDLFEKVLKKIDATDIEYGDNTNFFEQLRGVVEHFKSPFSITMGYYLINLFYNKYNSNERINEYFLNELSELKKRSKDFVFTSLGMLDDNNGIIGHMGVLMPIIKRIAKDGVTKDMGNNILECLFDGTVVIGVNNAETIEEIIVPEGVVEIEQDAFSNCSNLKVLSLPKSLRRIGNNFLNCLNLKDIYYDGTIEDWCRVRFGYANYCSTEANPMFNGENFYIVDSEGDKVFNGKIYSLLEELVIPKNIKLVDTYVFYGFRCLKKIIIPSTVTTIGYSTFGECKKLEMITMEKGINSIRLDAFDGCNMPRVIYEGTVNDWEKIFVLPSDSEENEENQSNHNAELIKNFRALYVRDNNGYINFNGKKYSNIK